MIFERWAAASRTLPGREVDEVFTEHRDEVLLFAFTTNRMEVGEHSGQFSVKFVTRGSERYRFGRRTIVLHPRHVLITNAGQAYSSAIDHRGTQSTSLFLPPSSVAAVGASRRNDATSLDRYGLGEIPEVPAVSFRARGALASVVDHLAAVTCAARPPSTDRVEEMALEVGALALCAALGLVPPHARFPCVRRATRDELLCRIVRARDFVQDAHGRVSLDEMARVACLSKYHFLRVFRDIVGCTPAEYARRVRLERGLERLRHGATARVAALRAGFASSSSFYRALRRHSTVAG